MTLVEHLEELRKRIIIALVSLAMVSALAFPFASKVLAILKYPSSGTIEKLAFFAPQEALLVHIKISFFIGFLISIPIILYQLWAFVSPAIDERVRRSGTAFLISSSAVFACGALFGYFILIPTAIKFLMSFSHDNLKPVISISSYTSFVMGLVLSSGLVFEMPVLSYLLSRVGIINPRLLRSKWKYAVVIILLIAGIVTPTPDVFNMIILAIPMLLLYKVSIWASKAASRP